MNKAIVYGVGIALTIAAFFFFFSRVYIEGGYVGVKVNLYGESKGVQAAELPPGKYWKTMNEEIYKFPIFTRTDKFDYDTEQAIPFQDVDGTKLQGPIGFSYHIERESVNLIFEKFRKGIEEISDEYIYLNVKNILNNEGGQMKVNDIYGAKKGELINKVEVQLRDIMAPFGIVIEKVYWSGDIGLPDTILKALNNKIEADQEQLQRKTQAETAISLADANTKLGKSITPELLSLRRIENEAEAIKKWNGELPKLMGSGVTPFINVAPDGNIGQ
jgi:regulator of protease activity HflC (stomatin/prohibitin superfamily)